MYDTLGEILYRTIVQKISNIQRCQMEKVIHFYSNIISSSIRTTHIECNHTAYFQTMATLKRAIEKDLLNMSLIAKLCQLEHPRIDCSRLINKYPDIREVD